MIEKINIKDSLILQNLYYLPLEEELKKEKLKGVLKIFSIKNSIEMFFELLMKKYKQQKDLMMFELKL
ncbi:hypothetical protein [Bizionia echini]|uniref:hypothetical protein n=1 Tax=Bizionia echini TaxID=649333 RepID=UPI001160B2B2|nr:hypothetical protein [Bizionia echini]